MTIVQLAGARPLLALVGRADFVPVKGKEFAQFRGEGDEIGGNAALGKEVEHGQEQEWFVGGAVGGNGRPRGAVLICVQVGKLV